MQVQETDIAGVSIFIPKVFGDSRGFFWETFSDDYLEATAHVPFIQDNHSQSVGGVLRGLHYRVSRPQGQLVTLLRGEIVDVVVDLRHGSPSFGRWVAAHLTEDGARQIYMPPGCAHGFYALGAVNDLHYKVTERYDPSDARSLRWDDPDIAIAWPLRETAPLVISDADRGAPFLRDLGNKELPQV